MNALALALILSAADGDGWLDAVLPVRTGWMELRGGGGYLHAWRDPPLGSAGRPLFVSSFRMGIIDRFTLKVLGGELLMVRPEGALPAVVLDLSSGVAWSSVAGASVYPTIALRLVWRAHAMLLELAAAWSSTFTPSARPPLAMTLGPAVRVYQHLTSWVSLGLSWYGQWALPPLPPFVALGAELLIRVSFTEHWHAELAGRWQRTEGIPYAFGATAAVVWTPQLWLAP